ncbi:hypothetical protein M1139_01850 [Candidatus Parvarchaeota archaeon]|nr:hypothetical protein [Candidatus Parvarchaeota archaeon]
MGWLKKVCADKKVETSDIEFLISDPGSLNKYLLGCYTPKYGRIDIFLKNIADSCYRRIKRESKGLSEFIENDSNVDTPRKEEFKGWEDGQLLGYTADKINEVVLHELTHKFGKAHHPQSYTHGEEYFVNSYIYTLYTDFSLSKLENEAKNLLKKYYNTQTYTTNDLNSKIRKCIDYSSNTHE